RLSPFGRLRIGQSNEIINQLVDQFAVHTHFRKYLHDFLLANLFVVLAFGHDNNAGHIDSAGADDEPRFAFLKEASRAMLRAWKQIHRPEFGIMRADDVDQRLVLIGLNTQLPDHAINPQRQLNDIAAAKYHHAAPATAEGEQLEGVARGFIAIGTVLIQHRLVFKEILLDWQKLARARLKVKMIGSGGAALGA